ncbi:hypothetical protein MMC09_002328 [Bachmanniomyces sp. S44760]|nr:hypothetical protein [Bachmanniomyces sp. S44760]
MPNYLLDQTLHDCLPQYADPPQVESIAELSSCSRDYCLGPSRHLIYFPPPTRLSTLLPDGTDPNHSPGEPFTRRMWAGGRLDFSPNSVSTRVNLHGQRAACIERISDVVSKGTPGEEKIFVTIERRIGLAPLDPAIRDSSQDPENHDRELLQTSDNCHVIEHRNLVFMRESHDKGAAGAAVVPDRVVKAPRNAQFFHTLIASAALLFRFSALTFNAHKIHLDRAYCRNMEGHRNLLVHGPLSLVLMVEVFLRKTEKDSTRAIINLEYRNLAPVYADEPMKVCGRQKGDNDWEVWIEGRDGGYAAKCTIETSHRMQP